MNSAIIAAEKANDFKPLFGAMFASELSEYTHWGWMDLQCVYGDLQSLVRMCSKYDIVTYPDSVCEVCSPSMRPTTF